MISLGEDGADEVGEGGEAVHPMIMIVAMTTAAIEIAEGMMTMIGVVVALLEVIMVVDRCTPATAMSLHPQQTVDPTQVTGMEVVLLQ